MGQFFKSNEQTSNIGLTKKKNAWVPCKQTETSATSTELNGSSVAKKEDTTKMQDVGASKESRA